MKGIDIYAYLKLFGGIFLIFPLVYGFYSLDGGNAFLPTLITYSVTYSLCVIGLNYLETGNIFDYVKTFEYEQEQEKNKKLNK